MFLVAFFLHLSEQYLTSSQFFSHALRHVIGRWQATQILLGRLALLPLKVILDICSEDCSLATFK